MNGDDAAQAGRRHGRRGFVKSVMGRWGWRSLPPTLPPADRGQGWVFATFGDGSAEFRAAAERLGQQAEQSGIFSETRVFDLASLKGCVPELASIPDCRFESRGLGYWAWKPPLLRHVMSTSGGRGVLYADAGCEIRSTPSAVRRLSRLLELAEEHGLLAEATSFSEAQYTKRALLDHLGVAVEGTRTRQVAATWVAAARTQSVLSLLDQWERLAFVDRLIDDSPSPAAEVAEFIEHRHDQSIFSCLMKAAGFPALEVSRGASRSYCRADSRRDPIIQHRNRTGISRCTRSSTLVSTIVGRSMDLAETVGRFDGKGLGRFDAVVPAGHVPDRD